MCGRAGTDTQRPTSHPRGRRASQASCSWLHPGKGLSLETSHRSLPGSAHLVRGGLGQGRLRNRIASSRPGKKEVFIPCFNKCVRSIFGKLGKLHWNSRDGRTPFYPHLVGEIGRCIHVREVLCVVREEHPSLELRW